MAVTRLAGGGLKIDGLAELEKALAELPKATARNTLRRVLKKAAEPVKEAMEARAPRETGYTAESIGVSATLNPTNRRDQKAEGKAFAEIHIGSRRGSAAHLQEFGTVNQSAHPYLRPAWAASGGPALRIITTELAGEIEKARARYARKIAKLAGNN